MAKIVVSPRGEKIIAEQMLRETYNGLSDLVSLVTNYLDSNYLRADMDVLNKFNEYEKQPIVIVLDTRKQPSEKKLDLDQLFYALQHKFQKIMSDKDERDKFLRQAVSDWFNRQITKSGNLSKY